MREIKFRAWDEESELMTDSNYEGGLREFFDHFDDCKLMQYTGLKDKKGVEIYEDDIVKIASRVTGRIIRGRIVFQNAYFAVDYLDGSYNSHLLIEFHKVEVIGNIYESPELLKQVVRWR